MTSRFGREDGELDTLYAAGCVPACHTSAIQSGSPRNAQKIIDQPLELAQSLKTISFVGVRYFTPHLVFTESWVPGKTKTFKPFKPLTHNFLFREVPTVPSQSHTPTRSTRHRVKTEVR